MPENIEIERKFLVNREHSDFQAAVEAAPHTDISQGYIIPSQDLKITVKADTDTFAFVFTTKEQRYTFDFDNTKARALMMLINPNATTAVRQADILPGSDIAVRIRIESDKAVLAVKGPRKGITGSEIELNVSQVVANALLRLAGSTINKRRYRIPVASGHTVELDIFADFDLVMAEVELASEDEAFDRPEWFAEEVSHDRRYSNAALSLYGLPA